MQASPPEIALALSRAGVSGVQKAVRIRRGDAETLMAAVIDCTVDLAADQKGVHMSRFPELFEEAIEIVVEKEALLVEVLAERIATNVVERQDALTRRGVDPSPVADPSAHAVTGLATQEMVSLCGIAAASESGTRRVGRRRGDRDQRLSVRAGARAQSRVGASPRSRLRLGDIERILELVPIATHNQRGRRRCSSAPSRTSTPRSWSTSSSGR